MPFSAGVFARVYNWATEQASPPIEISKLDTQEADIATGLSNCLLRDGTGIPTADISWNSKKITSLADAAAATDAVNRQSGDARWLRLVGTPSGSFVEGTYTGTLTGVSGTVTTVVSYQRMGNLLLVAIQPASGTSTTNAFTITGAPAAIRPASTSTMMASCAGVLNNGTSDAVPYSARLLTNGTIEFYAGLGSPSGFTASGSKGIATSGCAIAFLVN